MKKCHQNGLKGHVFVALLLGDVERTLEHVVAGAAQIWLASTHFRKHSDFAVDLLADERGIGAYFLKDEFHKRLAFRYYGLQQVYWFNLLLACRAGVFQRFLDSLLRFDGETVEIHTVEVFKYSWNPEWLLYFIRHPSF